MAGHGKVSRTYEEVLTLIFTTQTLAATLDLRVGIRQMDNSIKRFLVSIARVEDVVW